MLNVFSLSSAIQLVVAHIYCGDETFYFTILGKKKLIIAQELEYIKALKPLELAK